MKRFLLLLFLSCGIPDQNEGLSPPATFPGASNASGGVMFFSMSSDSAISYLLRYKIYPFRDDSEVTDLVAEDVDYFENNSTVQTSVFANRRFYKLKLIDSSTEEDSEDFLATSQGQNVRISKSVGNRDSGLFLNDESIDVEIARDVFRDEREYKSFYNEYETNDKDVQGRSFTQNGGVAVFLIVQAVKLDPKNLLGKIYSSPQAVGYFLIEDVFNNDDG